MFYVQQIYKTRLFYFIFRLFDFFSTCPKRNFMYKLTTFHKKKNIFRNIIIFFCRYECSVRNVVHDHKVNSSVFMIQTKELHKLSGFK